VSPGCPAGCCPHAGAAQEAECPADLPEAPLPERAAHLYACQRLSTYKIAAIAGIDRQRVTLLLHQAGITVKPHGAGRRMTRRTPEYERLDQVMVRLYVEQRMASTRIAALTGIPEHAVLDRLRARGVLIRTRGRFNREDRVDVSPDDLDGLYLRAGLSADEVGKLLGVSHRIVLRSAHDQGLPVRVGGAPPLRGPSEIELLTALYADPEVRRILDRHGVPVVPLAGPIWERFPTPHPLTASLVIDLYEGCGLSLRHIELLTGRPAAAAAVLLRAGGIQLRPAGGRSPFMRRWRGAERDSHAASSSAPSSPRPVPHGV
jgi:predicted HTH domain antitoxin